MHSVLQLLFYPRDLRSHVSAARLVEEVLVEDGDDATLTAAMFVGSEAVVGGVGLSHAPAACARHGAVTGSVDGTVFGADETVRERRERVVTAGLDNGDRSWLGGALLGVPTLALGATLGYL